MSYINLKKINILDLNNHSHMNTKSLKQPNFFLKKRETCLEILEIKIHPPHQKYF